MTTQCSRVSRRIAAVLACAIATACSSGVVVLVEDGDPVAEDDIVGRWSWVRSTGGIAGTIRTPETEGFTGVLRFEVDGTVEWRVDGELRWSTTWMLARAPEGSPLAGKQVVRYGEPVVGWDEQAVRLDGTRLVLTDPCCDGFVHEYEAVAR